MIKKLILIGVGCLISLGSYASVMECYEAAIQQEYSKMY